MGDKNVCTCNRLGEASRKQHSVDGVHLVAPITEWARIVLRCLSTFRVATSSYPTSVPMSVHANNVKRQRATPPRATDLKFYANPRLAGRLKHGKQFPRFDDNMLVWRANEAHTNSCTFLNRTPRHLAHKLLSPVATV
jgi:hypothetical protein